MKKYFKKYQWQKYQWKKLRHFNFIKLLYTCLTIVLALCCAGCGNQLYKQQSVDTAMGTIINQTIYVTDEESEAAKEVLQCIERLEQESLSWRLETSELYRINESAGTAEGIRLSQEMQAVLEQSMAVAESSGGAFDPTIGKVVRLWNIDEWAVAEDTEKYELPTQEELTELLADCGYNRIALLDNQIYLPENMQLDLGAVGKGIALDEIAALFEQQKEVTGAVISVGGSILTYGSKEDGSSWKVGVVDPFDTGKQLGALSLNGQWCVSTSGDYERFVEVDGVRYHHILNPHTGMPADSGVRSVTILSKSGLYSDALSTACFVLGVEKGMELAESMDAEALFVDENGEVTMTDGMEGYFHLSNS